MACLHRSPKSKPGRKDEAYVGFARGRLRVQHFTRPPHSECSSSKDIRFRHDAKDLQCATKHADGESATAIRKLILDQQSPSYSSLNSPKKVKQLFELMFQPLMRQSSFLLARTTVYE
ncbi:Uncharacterized protein DAT39_001877 [Clarias magur]|uniref:Uncharacterized protein n=1 Tax=Clarias magur TaxID=1594786 RepID=A0A8J4XGD0_CLAMG|nr:Uncharacterized protein DAT39_001877 [Clarias magur]